MRIRLLTYLTALALFVSPLYAADVTIRADATPTRVNTGESFVYTVEVTGSAMSLPNPQVDIPGDFSVRSGPNSSTNVSYVNGAMTASRTLTYYLVSYRAGSYTIPSPTVKYKRQTITGNAITITVGSTTAQQQKGNQGSGNSGNSGATTNSRDDSSARDRAGEDIFVVTELSTDGVYFQEAVTVTFMLYFKENQRVRYDIRTLASTEGFWTEEYKLPQRPDPVQRIVRGQKYNVAPIHRLILFPTTTGELTIGGMEVVCEIEVPSRRRQSRSLFDSFFDSPYDRVQKIATSNPVTLTVKPLPKEGRPPGFQEIVGKYNVRADVDLEEVQTNESVTLTVKVSGEGNIGFLPAPKLKIPPDIEMYDPKVEESHKPVAGEIRGVKSFQYLLIPRRSGEQRIPPIEYSYFDPKAERYINAKTDEIILNVRPATGWAASEEETSRGSREEVMSLNRDIRFIHDAAQDLRRQGPPVQEKLTYQLAYLFPLAIIGLAFGLRRRFDLLAGDVDGQRKRKAAKIALAVLQEAKGFHQESQIEKGYNALAAGILQYISDRTGVARSELDNQRAKQVLQDNGVDDTNSKQAGELIDRCNMARFTPGGMKPEALGELIDSAQQWIQEVERLLDSPVKRVDK
ncbi:BatD family protein [bacterium]|nr:BatD family protein [bacterium]